MVQSTSRESKRDNLHVAIIMDGNGRWATSQGLPRGAGHVAGADAVRRAMDAATRLPIHTLTLFAFTSGNWERPLHEVAALMELFRGFFCAQKAPCVAKSIRVSVIGRRDRLDYDLRAAIDETLLGKTVNTIVYLNSSAWSGYAFATTFLRAP